MFTLICSTHNDNHSWQIYRISLNHVCKSFICTNITPPCSQFSSVQLLRHFWLFATQWSAACQASLSITNSRSPPKPMSIESVMPSSHLILCHPLLLLPSIFPSIRVFSNESALHIRWPKCATGNRKFKSNLSVFILVSCCYCNEFL